MDTGIPFCASDFARRSVVPTLWGWKNAAHINQLEAALPYGRQRRGAQHPRQRQNVLGSAATNNPTHQFPFDGMLFTLGARLDQE